MAGAVAPGPVLGGLGVEAGTPQAEGRYQEGGRGRAACAEVVAGAGSCCSQAVDTLEPWWEAGKRRAGVPEGVPRVVGTRGMAGWAGHSWAAWARKRGLRSSSWTAGSGSPPQTCRNW